ncbi:MAG: hypothetical protein AB7E80_14420 [Hyphomicrobiaceae bacterium]
MEYQPTRREFTGGMAGATAAGFFGIAALGTVPAPVTPPPILSGLPDYIVEEVHNLYSAACDERRLWSAFARGEDCGNEWKISHILKVDGAVAIRDWVARNAPWQHALNDWLDTVHSKGHATANKRLQIGSAGYEDAWAVLKTEPRTMADAAAHRRAVHQLYG